MRMTIILVCQLDIANLAVLRNHPYSNPLNSASTYCLVALEYVLTLIKVVLNQYYFVEAHTYGVIAKLKSIRNV
jgi:hypothetical protein